MSMHLGRPLNIAIAAPGSCASKRQFRLIVDATLVPAPKQRNTEVEKEAIKEGKAADAIWPDNPARAA